MNLFNHIIASAFVLVKCLKIETQFLLFLKFSAYLKIEIQYTDESEIRIVYLWKVTLIIQCHGTWLSDSATDVGMVETKLQKCVDEKEG